MLFLLGIYLFSFLLPLSEIFIYPGIIKNYLCIQPFALVVIATMLAMPIRKLFPKKLWSKFSTAILYEVIPVLTILALLFRALEILVYSNFVFQNFHIDPVQTGIYCLYASIMVLPLANFDFVKKYWRASIFIFSLFSLNLLLLHWINPELFFLLKKEDQIVEYLQLIFFIVSSILSFLSIMWIKKLRVKKWQRSLLIVFFVILGSGLLFVSIEEISWGQRLLKIDTPEEIARDNIQDEITIHNNVNVFKYVYTAYLFINLYGLLSWIPSLLLQNKISGFARTLLTVITTRWYVSLFFIPNLVYAVLLRLYGNVVIDQWEEYTELYLAAGVFIVCYLNFVYLKRQRSK